MFSRSPIKATFCIYQASSTARTKSSCENSQGKLLSFDFTRLELIILLYIQAQTNVVQRGRQPIKKVPAKTKQEKER